MFPQSFVFHLGENVAFGVARLGRHRFEGSDLPEEAVEQKEEADGRFLTQSEHFQHESTACERNERRKEMERVPREALGGGSGGNSDPHGAHPSCPTLHYITLQNFPVGVQITPTLPAKTFFKESYDDEIF